MDDENEIDGAEAMKKWVWVEGATLMEIQYDCSWETMVFSPSHDPSDSLSTLHGQGIGEWMDQRVFEPWSQRDKQSSAERWWWSHLNLGQERSFGDGDWSDSSVEARAASWCGIQTGIEGFAISCSLSPIGESNAQINIAAWLAPMWSNTAFTDKAVDGSPILEEGIEKPNWKIAHWQPQTIDVVFPLAASKSCSSAIILWCW
jgi:hypothetical protein